MIARDPYPRQPVREPLLTTTSPTTTQSDIARLAGVTRLTVQRALQDRPGVGEATAQRIKQIAKAHGYMPNAAATATRTGRFNAVGLVIGSATPRYLPAELVHGVEQPLIEAGYQLLFSSLSQKSLASERLLPRVLQQLMVDGLLMHYTHGFPENLPDQIVNNRVPTVWINTRLAHDCVYLDDRAAAHQATRLLLEHGHRRICFAQRDAKGHYSEADRQAGYEQAMREAGLQPFVAEIVHPANQSAQQDVRFEQCRAVLSGPDRPTAVLAYSGSTHAGPLMGAALSLGLRIPEDLSLIAFDRVDFSPLGIPLTCVSTSMEAAANRAVQMLQQKIDHPDRLLPAIKLLPPINAPVSVSRPTPTHPAR